MTKLKHQKYVMSKSFLSGQPSDSPGDEKRKAALKVLAEMEALAENLPDAEDRKLLLQFLAAEESRCEMAGSLGIPRSNLRRRAVRLAGRVLQPAFQSAIVHMRLLESAEQALVREAVLAGRPLRELSRIFGVSIHEVRKRRSALQAKLRRLADESGHARQHLHRQLNRSIVARLRTRTAICRDLAIVVSVCSVLARSSKNVT